MSVTKQRSSSNIGIYQYIFSFFALPAVSQHDCNCIYFVCTFPLVIIFMLYCNRMWTIVIWRTFRVNDIQMEIEICSTYSKFEIQKHEIPFAQLQISTIIIIGRYAVKVRNISLSIWLSFDIPQSAIWTAWTNRIGIFHVKICYTKMCMN